MEIDRVRLIRLKRFDFSFEVEVKIMECVSFKGCHDYLKRKSKNIVYPGWS